jgi:hypothetical protein
MAMLLQAAAAAHAADDVTDAIDAAYPAYRAALFRTNAGAAAESAQAVAAAQQAWAGMRKRYESAPPPPYDRDARFSQTLTAVDAVYARAAVEVREQHLPQAHETLEAVRDLLGELRRRNGVIVYSDHVNAYHAQMERVLKEGPGLLGSADGLPAFTLEVGVLDHLAQRLSTEAGPTLLAQAGFGDAVREVLDSVGALRRSVLAQDPAAARRAVSTLKPPFSRLFLHFG